MTILVFMNLIAFAAVSLLLAVTVGCGYSQEPGTPYLVPSVVSDAGSDGGGDANPDSGRETLPLYVPVDASTYNPCYRWFWDPVAKTWTEFDVC